MTHKRKLLLNGMFFTGLAGIGVFYVFSFSQVPRRIEESVELGDIPDTSESVVLWHPCCSPPDCGSPPGPPHEPADNNPILPYSSTVSVKIVSAYTSSANEFWLESPSPPELLWDDPRGHEGEEKWVGCYNANDELQFLIRAGVCDGMIRYPLVFGEAPVWTLKFEDWCDCSWDDLVAEVKLIVIKNMRTTAWCDVKLPGIDDPVFLGEFNGCDDFEVRRNYGIGDAIMGTDKNLEFYLEFELDACPGRCDWEPTSEIAVYIDGFDDISQTRYGWEPDWVCVERTYGSVDEDDLGDHSMRIEFEFKDSQGNHVGDQTQYTLLRVFFDKSKKWHWDAEGLVKNWLHFWRRIPELADHPLIEARYAWYLVVEDPFEIKLGYYWPQIDDDKYVITWRAGEAEGIRAYRAYPCCMLAPWIVQGIDGFAFACQHENHHRTNFNNWWGSYANWWEQYPTQDQDKDYVPTWIEEPDPNLEPDDPCSHPCKEEFLCGCNSKYIKNDFEYITYLLHDNWSYGHWNHLDWAYPGKQTDPRF